MSLFPSAPDIFVNKTGADSIASSDPNNAYDAIETLENFLGASGEPQSKLATLINAFRNMWNPLPACSWIDADTISIGACSAVLFATNNFVIKRNTAAITCCLSLHIDTGSELASKWYDLYLVGDGANSAFTAKFVLQGSTPSGLTYYKKINSFYNNALSNILRFFQQDKLMMWDTPIVIATTISAGSWSGAISCTNAMPNISMCAIFGGYSSEDDGAQKGLWLRPNGSVGSTQPENGIGNSHAVSGQAWGNKVCMTDSLQQIQYYNDPSDAAMGLSIEGYYINLT